MSDIQEMSFWATELVSKQNIILPKFCKVYFKAAELTYYGYL